MLKMSSKLFKLLLICVMIATFSLCFIACDKNASSEQQGESGPKTYNVEVTGGHILVDGIKEDVTWTTGDFKEKEKITIVADVPEGYEFVRWYITGKETSTFATTASYSFDVKTNRKVTAEFRKLPYTITITGGYISSVDGTAETKKPTSGKYYDNQEITIKANAVNGLIFVRWYDKADKSELSRNSEYTFKASKSIDIVAYNSASGDPDVPMEEDEPIVTVKNGYVGDKAGTTSRKYRKGDFVDLHAVVADTDNFVGWYETTSGEEEFFSNQKDVSVQVKYSRTFTAKSEPKPFFDVVVTNGTADLESVMQGASVTLTADVDTNRTQFNKWEIKIGDVTSYSTEKECVVENVTAKVEAKALYYSKVWVNAYVQDTLAKIGQTQYILTDEGTCTFTPPDRSSESNKVFVEWVTDSSEHISYKENYAFSSSEDLNVYAVYESIPTGKVKIVVNNGQAYSTYNTSTKQYFDPIDAQSAIFNEGTIVYIKPAINGSKVTYSSKAHPEEDELNAANGYSLTLIPNSLRVVFNCSMELTATFENVIDKDGVEIKDSRKLNLGDTYRFIAKESERYILEHWEVSGYEIDHSLYSVANGKNIIDLPISNEYIQTSILESKNLTIKAFLEYLLLVQVENGTINEKTSELVHKYSDFTVVADEIEGKVFKGWRKNNSSTIISTDKELNVVDIREDVKYIAEYYDIYEITLHNETEFTTTLEGTILETDGDVYKVEQGKAVTFKTPDVGLDTAFNGWVVSFEGGKETFDISKLIKNGGYFSYSYVPTANCSVNVYMTGLHVTVKNQFIADQKIEDIEAGQEITITAAPHTGYQFGYWDIAGDRVEENPYTFKVYKSLTITAHYDELVKLTIINADDNNGTTTIDVIKGSEYTARATNTEENRRISSWLNASDVKISELEEYVFTVTADTTIKAVFSSYYKVTLVNGTFNDGVYKGQTIGYYIEGSSINVIGDDVTGYIGTIWTDSSSNQKADTKEALFQINDKDDTYTYNLQQVYTVTIRNNVNSTVDVQNTSYGYEHYWVVAPVIEGYKFYKWSISYDGKNVESYDSTYVINFVYTSYLCQATYKKTYTLTIINESGYGSKEDIEEREVDGGSAQTVSVTNEVNGRLASFAYWKMGDTIVSYEPTYVIPSVDADTSIEAVFNMMYTQQTTIGSATSLANIIANATELASNISGAFVIPGIKQGENFVLQGIDYDNQDGFVYLAGYINPTNTINVTNSVVFVVNMSTGQLVKEIILLKNDGTPYVGHIGGVAVTSKYLWIATDSEGGIGSSKLQRIKLSDIKAGKPTCFLKFMDKANEAIITPVNASYISYIPTESDRSKGVLLVGEYEDTTYGHTTISKHKYTLDSTLAAWTIGYYINENPSDDYLDNGFKYDASQYAHGSSDTYTAYAPDFILWHSGHVQGVTIAGSKLILSESSGKNNQAYLQICDLPFDIDNFSDSTCEGKELCNGTDINVPYWIIGSSDGTTYNAGKMTRDLAVYDDGDNCYILVANESGAYQNSVANIGEATICDVPSEIVWMVKIEL